MIYVLIIFNKKFYVKECMIILSYHECLSNVSVCIDAGQKDFYNFIKMFIFFKNTCIVAIPNTASYFVIMHTAEV